MHSIHDDVSKILISEEELKVKIRELGKKITEDYADEQLIVVGILKGASVFMSDLIREIDSKIEVDFMVVSSYGNSTTTTGVVRILKDLETDIEGYNILLVEDIIDTGITLSYLKNYLYHRNAKSVRICTLLNKPSRREKAVEIDYEGFQVPDEFIVGYGIDYAENYRNLPYIGALKREIYS
jgi:hypoxanthine phosphoribosyltransferase